jgi:hypothetical protein
MSSKTAEDLTLSKLCKEVNPKALDRCIRIATRAGAEKPERGCCYLIQKYGEDAADALGILAEKGLLRAPD